MKYALRPTSSARPFDPTGAQNQNNLNDAITMQEKSALISPATLSCGLLLVTLPALHAATLGEARVRSLLGEGLLVSTTVSMRDDEKLTAECFSVDGVTGDENGVPLTGLRKSFSQKGNSGQLLVESLDSVSEPIVRMNIRMNCPSGSSQARTYTLLLDLPRDKRPEPTPQAPISPQLSGRPTNPAKATSARVPDKLLASRADAAPASSTAGGGSTEAPPRKATPAQPSVSSAPVDGVVETDGRETLNQIARRLYPEDRAARDHFRDVLRERYGDALRDGNRRLRAGMKLEIPKPDAKPAAPKPPAPVAVAKAPLRSADTGKPPAPPVEKPTFSIGPVQSAPGKQDKNSDSKDGKGKKGRDETAEKLEALQQMLDERISEQIAAQHSLQDNIDKLEKYTLQLQEKLKAQDKALAAERQARDAAALEAAQWHTRDWLAVAAIVLAILTLGALLLGLGRRREQQSNGLLGDMRDDLMPTDTSESRSAAEERAIAFAMMDSEPHDGEPVAAVIDTKQMSPNERPHTPGGRRARRAQQVLDLPLDPEPESDEDPHSAPPVALQDVEVLHLTNRIEEAMLLSEHGMVNQAVSILRDEIARRPQYVNAWLSLLKVFHANGWRDDFIPLAGLFRQQFLSKAMWKQVAAMGRDLAPEEEMFASTDASSEQASTDAGLAKAPPEPEKSLMNDVELVFSPLDTAKPADDDMSWTETMIIDRPVLPVTPPARPAPVNRNVVSKKVAERDGEVPDFLRRTEVPINLYLGEPEATKPTRDLAKPAVEAPNHLDIKLVDAIDLEVDAVPDAKPAPQVTKPAANSNTLLDSGMGISEVDFMGPDHVDPKLAEIYPRLSTVADYLFCSNRAAAINVLQQCLIEGDWEEKTEALRLLGHMRIN